MLCMEVPEEDMEVQEEIVYLRLSGPPEEAHFIFKLGRQAHK